MIETVVSEKYEAFSYRIASRNCAKECSAEGYPSHGENYDLRMQDEGWKDYLPSFMGYDRVVE